MERFIRLPIVTHPTEPGYCRQASGEDDGCPAQHYLAHQYPDAACGAFGEIELRDAPLDREDLHRAGYVQRCEQCLKAETALEDALEEAFVDG